MDGLNAAPSVSEARDGIEAVRQCSLAPQQPTLSSI
jgi:hypothetical protein